jgi:hypothetical protein
MGYEGVDWIQQASTDLVAGFCNHTNEMSGSIRDREFFDQLSDY